LAPIASVEPDRAATSSEADDLVASVKNLFDMYHTMSIAAASGPRDPWIAKVFFVDDEPSPGKMDVCCALINTSRKFAMMRETGRIAFVVAGDHRDHETAGGQVADGRALPADGPLDGGAHPRRPDEVHRHHRPAADRRAHLCLRLSAASRS
jgi:hypothetical protein